ncbi:MAG: hypothetical protein AB7O28_14760 [Vicinamibacterales bacterium]
MPDTEVAARLREVILALDERHVQPGRAGEARIAKDSSDMRALAVARLAEVQPDPRDDSGAIAITAPPDAGRAARPFQEASVTTPVPIRPPPSTPTMTDVPADFDHAMAERWRAWRERGPVEHARARRRGVLALSGAALAALAVFLLLALLR